MTLLSSLIQAAVPSEASPTRLFCLVAAAGFLAISALTYLVTTTQHLVRVYKSKRGDGGSTEPPLVPYTIPVLGCAIPFSFDTLNYLSAIRKRYGNTPLQLQVGGMKLYLLPHGDPLVAMYKGSKYLGAKILTVLPLKRSFDMSDKDLQPWIGDDSGISIQPLPGHEHMDPWKRVFYITHRDLHGNLQGPALNALTGQFIKIYTQQLLSLEELSNKDDWVEIPDLHAFLQRHMLTAALQGLCGKQLLELCPTFVEDFWAFDEGIPNLFKMVPRWLYPAIYRNRDTILLHLRKWHEHTLDKLDYEDADVMEENWSPVYGARVMRARFKMYLDNGVSPSGRASQDLGLVWATNSNVIPATTFAVMDVLRTGITPRLLAEVDSCFAPGGFDVDVERLCSRPLLGSVYMETLRLRSSAGSARQPTTAGGFQIGPWSFKGDGTIFTVPWLAHRDTAFWNTGRDDDPHPVDGFWAERFLEYPGAPWTGPIRKYRKDEKAYQDAPPPLPVPGRVEEEEEQKKSRPATVAEWTADDDRNAKLVTTGIQGHWLPYGGGTKICPGRYFAKQEMMAAVAVLLRVCDVELVDPAGAEKVGMSLSRFPMGTLVPDAKIPVRIRRRHIG